MDSMVLPNYPVFYNNSFTAVMFFFYVGSLMLQLVFIAPVFSVLPNCSKKTVGLKSLQSRSWRLKVVFLGFFFKALHVHTSESEQPCLLVY